MSRDHRVTHRAARLPLDKSAGGGAVDNPTSQGFTYRQQNPVQLNRTSSVAIPQFIKAFKYSDETTANPAYYRISGESRLTYSIYYLGLTGFLSMMAYELHTMLRLH